MFKTTLLRVIVFVGIAALVVVYKDYNPSEQNFFPKCPFLTVTGYECAGCGSQRAIHHLFNGEIVEAFKFNQLLVLSIPYLLLGVFFDSAKNLSEATLLWRRRLYGTNAILLVLIIVISFWIGRNLF